MDLTWHRRYRTRCITHLGALGSNGKGLCRLSAARTLLHTLRPSVLSQNSKRRAPPFAAEGPCGWTHPRGCARLDSASAWAPPWIPLPGRVHPPPNRPRDADKGILRRCLDCPPYRFRGLRTASSQFRWSFCSFAPWLRGSYYAIAWFPEPPFFGGCSSLDHRPDFPHRTRPPRSVSDFISGPRSRGGRRAAVHVGQSWWGKGS